MIDYIFYYENERYIISQRTYFSNVFIYNKSKKSKKYIDPAFFIRILKASICDVDIVFTFPWKMDLVENRLGKRYIEGYKKYWNVIQA